jgi:hypothetical protein
MSVKAFFAEFEPGIQKIFERAKAQAGSCVALIRLELTDQARGAGAKADIYVLPMGPSASLGAQLLPYGRRPERPR